MELKSLSCPNCGAILTTEDGVDIFYCKYCGHRIILDGQSDAAYEAKVRVKHMEHKERMQERRYAQERYRMEKDEEESRKGFPVLLISLFFLAMAIVIPMIFLFSINNEVKQQEQKLQAIVDEIMVDIQNEDFSSAYVKANSLYWEESGSSSDKDKKAKWDSTRKEVIQQIQNAEKQAKKEKGEGGFWDWFG